MVVVPPPVPVLVTGSPVVAVPVAVAPVVLVPLAFVVLAVLVMVAAPSVVVVDAVVLAAPPVDAVPVTPLVVEPAAALSIVVVAVSSEHPPPRLNAKNESSGTRKAHFIGNSFKLGVYLLALTKVTPRERRLKPCRPFP